VVVRQRRIVVVMRRVDLLVVSRRLGSLRDDGYDLALERLCLLFDGFDPDFDEFCGLVSRAACLGLGTGSYWIELCGWSGETGLGKQGLGFGPCWV